MKLYIPKLTQELKLIKDWKFKLYYESRNTGLFPNTEKYTYKNRPEPVDFILPKDTILKVDRYYIRNGAPDYDSVTFRISYCPDSNLNKKRFWVKLDDANNIEFENAIYNKTISLKWNGYISSTYPQFGLIDKNYINNHVNTHLSCNIDNVLRFKISKDLFTCDPTQENWITFGFSKRLFRGKQYDSLNLYFNDVILSNRYYGRSKLDQFVLINVKYILTDFKTHEEYESNSVNTLKDKARKILKEENKN